MQNWKKAVIFGALGAGAVAIVTGRRPLGIGIMAGGLAILASEYPEKFEDVWENAPEYVNRATKIFMTLQQISERFAEEAERRGAAQIRRVREEYGV